MTFGIWKTNNIQTEDFYFFTLGWQIGTTDILKAKDNFIWNLGQRILLIGKYEIYELHDYNSWWKLFDSVKYFGNF